jgi:hypothetical protein
MNVRLTIAAAALLAYGAAAVAKLPPPTPEEEAKAAQDQEKKKAAAAEAQEATKRVQDRVAAQYIARMAAKGITVHPTPVDGPTHAAVTTAPGKTPAESDAGQASERNSVDQGGKGSGGDATHAESGKHSNK